MLTTRKHWRMQLIHVLQVRSLSEQMGKSTLMPGSSAPSGGCRPDTSPDVSWYT